MRSIKRACCWAWLVGVVAACGGAQGEGATPPSDPPAVSQDGQPGGEPTQPKGSQPERDDHPDLELVGDLNRTDASSGASPWIVLGDTAFLTADDGVHGVELWRTDGAGKTELVADLKPGVVSSRPTDFLIHDGAMYFIAAAEGAPSLWKVTEAGAPIAVAPGIAFDDSYSVNTAERLVSTPTGLFFKSRNAFGVLPKDGPPRLLPTQAINFAPLGDGILVDTYDGLAFGRGTDAQLTPVRLGQETLRPLTIFSHAGVAYFTALRDGAIDLLRTDGTTAGTSVVRRLSEAGAQGGSVGHWAGFGAHVFFTLDAKTWMVTDGTDAGTVTVGSGDLSFAQPLGERLILGGASHVRVTDGTVAGTRDLGVFGGPFATRAATSGDAVYFLFSPFDQQQDELWKTDGTTVQRAARLSPGYPSHLLALGDRIVFGCPTPAGDEELCQFDGAQTTVVANLNHNTDPSSVANATRLGDRVLFTATDGTSRRLFSTSLAGTELLQPVAGSFIQSGELAVLGDRAYFIDGNKLSATAGTPGTTEAIATVSDVAHWPSRVVSVGGALYFANFGSRGETTLYRSDGTTAGTGPAIGNGVQPSTDRGPFFASGAVHFWGSTSLSPFASPQLYRIDGDQAVLVDADAKLAVPFQDGLLVSRGAQRPFALASGDVVLRSLQGSVVAIKPGQHRAFYSAGYFYDEREVGVTDGTPEGTHALPIPDLPNGLDGVVLGDQLIFNACQEGGCEPWTSDGTDAGTHRLADLCPGPCSSSPSRFLVAGGRVWFQADDGVHGEELWSTDGTAGGTQMAKAVGIAPVGSSPIPLLATSTRLYFTADDGHVGDELWRVRLP